MSPAKEEAMAMLDRLGRRGKALTEYDAKRALAAWGVPIALERVVKSADEAAQAAAEIGFPVVAKISSVDIPHKTEAKAVKIGLKDEAAVRRAFDEVMANSLQYAPSADIDGVLIQEMVSGGTEVIIGVTHDAQFGPTIMFGLGGIFVEVLKDVTFRVAPIGLPEARRMIEDIRAVKVLEGARGRQKADVEALARLLVSVSEFASDTKALVQELDMNPVLVLPEGQGLKVIDALIVPAKGAGA
jgi:succinyl-CoA synthetase beta subunit